MYSLCLLFFADKGSIFTASEVVDSYLKACELMKRDSTGYADYKKSREILENILPYANDDIKSEYCREYRWLGILREWYVPCPSNIRRL